MERGPLEVANSLWWPEHDLAEKPLGNYFQFTSGVNIRTHYVPGSTSSAAITRVGILGGGRRNSSSFADIFETQNPRTGRFQPQTSATVDVGY